MIMKEDLQNEDLSKKKVEPVDTDNKCGGKPFPPPPVGEIGFWDCVNGQPVWIPA